MMDFIEKSPSCYHVIANLKDALLQVGYVELLEEEPWELKGQGLDHSVSYP